MNFSEALYFINKGDKVTRKKWGKKAAVYLVNNRLNNISHIEIRTLGSCLMYGASSEDLLALDWELVDNQPIKQTQQEDIVL